MRATSRTEASASGFGLGSSCSWEDNSHRAVSCLPAVTGCRRTEQPIALSLLLLALVLALVAVTVFAMAMPETSDSKTERNVRETTAGSPPQPIVAD
jgi:hypothetical protein